MKQPTEGLGLQPLILIVSVAISLLFLIYAFVQKAEAAKQRELSVGQMNSASKMQKMAIEEIMKKDSIILVLKEQLKNCE